MTATSLGLSGPLSFRGAYIKAVNANLGLAQNPSTCTLTLAEDVCQTPQVLFNEPKLGGFVSVTIGSQFKFDGIVTKYERDIRNISGRYITVNISDVREIMRNMPVILAPGYAGIANHIGTLTSCSLIDVYGAFDQTGFNFSGWNQSGMPFESIRIALVAGAIDVPGQPRIEVAAQGGQAFGESYRFNLDALVPFIDPDYRVNTNLISMADLIQELSSKHSFDWFIETNGTSGSQIEVKIIPIDRRRDNIDIDLAGFLAANSGIVSTATSGVELRNDVACAVLVGAPVEGMRIFNVTACSNSPVDLSDIGGFSEYFMTEIEMRVVLGGKEAWKEWASLVRSNLATIEFGDRFEDYPELTKEQLAFDALKMTEASAARYGFPDNDFRPVKLPPLPEEVDDKVSTTGKSAHKRRVNRIEEIREVISTRNKERRDTLVEIQGKIYERLKSSAEATYGKRFRFTGSSDVDYIDAAWTFGVIGGNDDPNEYFRNDDGKTRCFVEFKPGSESAGTVVTVNQSNLGLGIGGGFAIGRPGNDVDLPLQNADRFTLEDVILEMDKRNYLVRNGRLYVAATIEDNRTTVRMESPILGAADDILYLQKLKELLAGDIADKEKDAEDNEKDVANAERIRLWRVNGYLADYDKIHGLAYQPVLVHIPTRSKFSRYGPVYSSAISSTSEGILSIEQDDGFSPWEFGSSQLMLDAMQLKVDNQSSEVKELQTANITLEGFPKFNLGDSLGKNSNINSISISLSGQVTTSYTLQSFQRKFGELTKQELALLSLFVRRGGARNIPQDVVSFIEKYRARTSRKFGGTGTSNSSTVVGGSTSFG